LHFISVVPVNVVYFDARVAFGRDMDSLQSGDPVVVGGYRLIGRLGSGGMGRVFLGNSPGGRKVAVKLIHPEHANAPEFRERFTREIEAARRVGGFHTAPVVDADPSADPPWMVTAYIPGPSLQAEVDAGGPLCLPEVQALGAGLAEGLAAIHACGLVHRDMKPGNVILAEDGPRIIDFGIARAEGASAMTTTGAVLGTFSYMSPEQIKGRHAGPASDVFSLGSTLAFAATGRSPFGSEAIATAVHRIVSEPPDLTGLTAQGGFRQLVTECLAKDPAERPPLSAILARLGAPGQDGLAGLSAAAAAGNERGPDTRTADRNRVQPRRRHQAAQTPHHRQEDPAGCGRGRSPCGDDIAGQQPARDARPASRPITVQGPTRGTYAAGAGQPGRRLLGQPVRIRPALLHLGTRRQRLGCQR
jgi:serine/threonine protein kinase